MSLKDTIKPILTPIHDEGYPFIGIFALLTLILLFLWLPLGLVGIVLTTWCIYFFRNPVRITPIREGLIIAPADGVIQDICHMQLPIELRDDDDPATQDDMLRISIFMNVFNVHVNRIPHDGFIIKQHYHKGKFFNASLDKASIHNERHSVLMQCDNNQGDDNQVKIGFVQIAGLVARRIICYLEDGQDVKAGEQYGIIRFGSRVDIYLPKETASLVAIGQLSVGGETVLADLNRDAYLHESARNGKEII